MRILKAQLREPLIVMTNISDIHFDEDVVQASSAFERTKRNMLAKMKNDMHDKIACLSINDLNYEVKNIGDESDTIRQKII